MVAVLGNHDFEAGKSVEIVEILSNVGVHVLDGKSCEIYGVGFAGVKGFAGGFNERAFPVRYLGTPGQYLSKIFYKL